MPTNLESIGLPRATEGSLDQLLQTLSLQRMLHAKVPGGHYHQWQCSSGAQLWLQTDQAGEFETLNPCFLATNPCKVSLVGSRLPKGFPTLERRLHLWMLDSDGVPSKDPSHPGLYPFEVDAVDGLAYDGVRLPAVASAHLAAFPLSDVEYFASEADMPIEEDIPRTAIESLIPSSLFGLAQGEESRMAHVLMSGRVRQSAEKWNDIGGKYYWMLLQTYGAVLDVVMGPADVPCLPAPGSVIRGTFWMSGRLSDIEEAPAAPRSFWKRLFSRG